MKVYRNKTRERVDSGIYGYNELLGGGYFKQTVNVIMGGAGTGKTIFGSQFLYQGAQSGKKGLYITTSEHVESLKKGNYSPPTAKFIINEVIFTIAMVVNKTFRLMDGEHDVHTYPR
uniref:Circadian clock protein kinase KaiC n=1 Tax=Candidatus Methanogaster sp. ANME-2c ERB4 TaxID=2759911 RepID=A0A7G9Y879_9EURY|nr:circadian clock protein kinase KaiC [Methanosarcinales archaeon ANME-2c ERB4]QNO44792.1 circadian clock protein kinase KaiC [Methanosarcinales archaeon ANME-2c ERB4]